MLEEGKQKTASRDFIAPDQTKIVPKEPVKQIGNGSNDIMERVGQKVVTEDGRELLK